MPERLPGKGTEDDIALVLGIDAKTLRKHFRVELDVVFVKANAKVAESIFMQAVGAPAQYYPLGHPDAGKLMRVEYPSCDAEVCRAFRL